MGKYLIDNEMRFTEFFGVSRDIFQSINFSSNSSSQLVVHTQQTTNWKNRKHKQQKLRLVTILLRVAQKSSFRCRTTLRDTEKRDV